MCCCQLCDSTTYRSTSVIAMQGGLAVGVCATAPPVVAKHINSSMYNAMPDHAAQDAIEGVLDQRPGGVLAPQLASLFSSPDTAARLQAALQARRALRTKTSLAPPTHAAAS